MILNMLLGWILVLIKCYNSWIYILYHCLLVSFGGSVAGEVGNLCRPPPPAGCVHWCVLVCVVVYCIEYWGQQNCYNSDLWPSQLPPKNKNQRCGAWPQLPSSATVWQCERAFDRLALTAVREHDITPAEGRQQPGVQEERGGEWEELPTVLLLQQRLVDWRLGSDGRWRRLGRLAVLAGTSPGGSHCCSCRAHSPHSPHHVVLLALPEILEAQQLRSKTFSLPYNETCSSSLLKFFYEKNTANKSTPLFSRGAFSALGIAVIRLVWGEKHGGDCWLLLHIWNCLFDI